MKQVMTRLACAVLFALVIGLNSLPVAAASQQGGQQSPRQNAAAATLDRVVGTVTAIDASAGRLDVKTDTGDTISVSLNEKVSYLRIPAGAETLDKATKVSVADIKVGDRVYARGKLAGDGKSMPARQVIIIAQSDIEQQRERGRLDWQQRGVAGVIATVDPQKQEITLQRSGRESAPPLVIAANQNTHFRRYMPNSVKFSDAKPSSIAELKAGDQVRVLGSKSVDGARMIGEEIVSGSFLTIGGTVTAVDVEKGEIKINTLKDKRQVTVSLSKDSSLRRIPQQMAAMFAQREPSGAAPAAPAPAQPPTGAQPPAAATARPLGHRTDLQEAFDHLPSLSLAEIKPGEMIVVSSTTGPDPSRVNAISVITGLEAVLRLAQASVPGRGRTPPNPNTGLPNGVLDFAMTLP